MTFARTDQNFLSKGALRRHQPSSQSVQWTGAGATSHIPAQMTGLPLDATTEGEATPRKRIPELIFPSAPSFHPR
jgi:hypothetical protein